MKAAREGTQRPKYRLRKIDNFYTILTNILVPFDILPISQYCMLNFPKPIVCLAPMDGITNTAYRQIVRKRNPEVVLFSEFTSINGIQHSECVRDRLNFDPAEIPYFVQIFGNEPKLFAQIVRRLNDFGITGIDINMGCPSPKIVKSNTGGSLMKDKDLACRIVETCRKNTTLPITVKTRLGWTDASQLIDFAVGLENAGAQMLSVHGRTYKQAYRGSADWSEIYPLKPKISIPVVGNGDVKGKEDGLQRMQNLDGFMIGRASIGNPWVFWPDVKRIEVTLKEKVATMIEHLQLIRKYTFERKALIEFRKHITGYITGFQGAKIFRKKLMQVETEKEFIRIAQSIG